MLYAEGAVARETDFHHLFSGTDDPALAPGRKCLSWVGDLLFLKMDVSVSFRALSDVVEGINFRQCCWCIDTASNP
jgi:hypothetical protein